MSRKFPSGGHQWARLSAGNPQPIEAWVVYMKNYLEPLGQSSEKCPARFVCKRCRIVVPKSGPREQDVLCIDVSVRDVMES